MEMIDFIGLLATETKHNKCDQSAYKIQIFYSSSLYSAKGVNYGLSHALLRN